MLLISLSQFVLPCADIFSICWKSLKSSKRGAYAMMPGIMEIVPIGWMAPILSAARTSAWLLQDNIVNFIECSVFDIRLVLLALCLLGYKF